MQSVAHGMIEILTPVRTFLRSGLTVWEQESPRFSEGRKSKRSSTKRGNRHSDERLSAECDVLGEAW